jgi:hypothetical protein
LVRRASNQGWREADLREVEELAQAEARENFWGFRCLMHPDMKRGWWIKEVSAYLQQFYQDYAAGLRPKLILVAPPQSGKSYAITDFIAWVSGKSPDINSVFTSYADSLGVRTNLALQRIITNERYAGVFPLTRINETGRTTDVRWQRNTDILEFVERQGSFRNTTIQGQITGHGLDMGFIDDPIKGRKEARSITVRNSTWEWMTDDFFTRFSETAAFLLIMTRWHVDDPVSRFMSKFPDTRLLRYPALAEQDERHRRVGEALFPEHKSKEFLLERKSLMSAAGFASEYQGAPYVVGGDLFPIEKINVISELPKSKVIASVRYWDKAGTEGGGSFTAGVLMHKMNDRRFVISDLRHGQWGALDRETRIEQTTRSDAATFGRYEVWVEQEPGSGG